MPIQSPGNSTAMPSSWSTRSPILAGRSMANRDELAAPKAGAGFGQAPMFDTEVRVASRRAVLVILPSKG